MGIPCAPVLADAGMASSQLVHNVDMLSRGVPIQDRYSPEYQALEREDGARKGQSTRHSNLCPKKNDGAKAGARRHVCCGASSYLHRLRSRRSRHRLRFKSASRSKGGGTEGITTAVTQGVGSLVSGLTRAANPLVRQATARAAQGATNAGQAYVSGERDTGTA